jgi:hypothetical protein
MNEAEAISLKPILTNPIFIGIPLDFLAAIRHIVTTCE